jgi:hypothetical protein
LTPHGPPTQHAFNGSLAVATGPHAGTITLTVGETDGPNSD